MPRRAALALVFPLAVACAEKLPEGHVMPLVDAERAFVRDVADRGTKEGFLAVIADDTVLLRPAPTPAREALAAPGPQVQLSWEPVYAEMSATADLGYTTGPYQARRKERAEIGYGHYVSVWQKRGQAWFLVVDGGGPHPPPLDLPDRFTYAPQRSSPPSPDRAQERKSLMAAEQALVAAFAGPEGARALLDVAAPDVRYYPPNSFPVIGVAPVQTALLGRADALTYETQGGDVSAAGDLGYVYGAATRQVRPQAPVEPGGYLRVWRRASDGRWQVALDLTITAPPRK